MDRFAEALLSRQANPALPAEDDWFAPLLGDWEFDYQDRGGRRLKGEWYFRRALDGMAIEDLFICPSRDTREENPQPDGEYGAAVRMYNPKRRCYDMTYICSKGTTRLEARKEGGRHRLYGAGGSFQPVAVCEGDRGHFPLAERDETGGGPPGELRGVRPADTVTAAN